MYFELVTCELRFLENYPPHLVTGVIFQPNQFRPNCVARLLDLETTASTALDTGLLSIMSYRGR